MDPKQFVMRFLSDVHKLDRWGKGPDTHHFYRLLCLNTHFDVAGPLNELSGTAIMT